jgi:hypothetical protein
MAANDPAPPADQEAEDLPTLFLSPWDGELDLSTKTGKSLWNEGIKPLETKFSGQGKDLPRFLADVSIRVNKCKWQGILTINGKSLLKNYGEISQQDVELATTVRNRVPLRTLSDTRPRVNALMLFHFLYDSLGPAPLKKLSTKLSDLNEDGPQLLKLVLDQTFVATQASTYAIKERFYELALKQYKWNVQQLNQDVREKLNDLIAAGHASDATDIIISLFRAYKTANNDEFLNAVDFWKNEWNSKIITTPEALMTRADNKYVELRDLGTWGKRSAKDDQLIALTAQLDSFRSQERGFKSRAETTNNDVRRAMNQWKLDRSASKTKELLRNNKTYKWCAGPGHNGQAMWVIHEPGTCTVNRSGSHKHIKREMKNAPKTKDTKQALAALLQNQDYSDDELESKLEAILAVMES